MSRINEAWYSKKKPPFFWSFLLPFEGLYRGIIFFRRAFYRAGFLKSHSFNVPVVVIGNITVGGVGKTPLAAELIQFLKKNHYHPGIISRGYKGKSKKWPKMVTSNSDPRLVGDEPVLLAQKCECPVVVGPDRVKAAHMLLENYDVNIIVSDDGLQHYALKRDIEILVIDGEREFGNGHCLPYGPLRESKERIRSVDFIVRNQGQVSDTEFPMNFKMGEVYNLKNPTQKKSLAEFKKIAVHAVAGIGNPKRFFQSLRDQGLLIVEHIFPDHHVFLKSDFDKIPKNAAIILTEKDAIKCLNFDLENVWALPIEAVLSSDFYSEFSKKLSRSEIQMR